MKKIKVTIYNKMLKKHETTTISEWKTIKIENNLANQKERIVVRTENETYKFILDELIEIEAE